MIWDLQFITYVFDSIQFPLHCIHCNLRKKREIKKTNRFEQSKQTNTQKQKTN